MRRRLDAQEGDKAAPVQGQDGQHTIDHLPGELVERIELDRTPRHTHTHTATQRVCRKSLQVPTTKKEISLIVSRCVAAPTLHGV